MKIIVAGGRDFNDYQRLEMALWDFDTDHVEIVSGGARGADALGERFAICQHVKLKRFPANWDRYGKSAGYIRNEQMANYASVLVAFWDGKSKGTKHMIDLALKHGLEVHVYPY